MSNEQKVIIEAYNDMVTLAINNAKCAMNLERLDLFNVNALFQNARGYHLSAKILRNYAIKAGILALVQVAGGDADA